MFYLLFNRLLPLLLFDLFSIEQSLSILFGEFIKQLHLGNAELFSVVIQKFITLVIERNSDSHQLIVDWVMICLNNFLQVEPFTITSWALTCVFLSVSRELKLKHLYPFFILRRIRIFFDSLRLKEISVKAEHNEDLFIVAAFHFYKELSVKYQQEFIKNFETKQNHTTIIKLINLCTKSQKNELDIK